MHARGLWKCLDRIHRRGMSQIQDEREPELESVEFLFWKIDNVA